MTSRETTQLLPLDEDSAIPARLSDRIVTWAWAVIQWPWLLRSLSGGDVREKAAILSEIGLEPDALPHLGSWKADTFYLRAIVDHIRSHRPSTVVELGAGASSLVAARALQRWGEEPLIAFDQHAGFVAATARWLRDHGVEADLRTAPLGPPPGDWPGAWYQLSNLPDRIDLLLVDGPPWTLHPFVRGAAESLFDRLPVGGTIFLDDGARPGERVVMARWQKRWPGFRFELLPGGTKGLIRGVRIR